MPDVKKRMEVVKTRLPVKMVAPRTGEPPIRCTLCGETTHIFVIRVETREIGTVDICYVCASNIDDATAYPTRCEKDINPKPLAASWDSVEE